LPVLYMPATEMIPSGLGRALRKSKASSLISKTKITGEKEAKGEDEGGWKWKITSLFVVEDYQRNRFLSEE
jgi:hypothetical protein